MRKRMELVVEDESGLVSAARQLIAFAGDEKIWAFYGEMGAGKTTFIRAICKELGVTVMVSSPTFSIVNEYNSGGGSVFHFDFYRIEKEEEAINIGCEEYFDSGSICLIEWPEKILNLLPKPCLAIRMKEAGSGRQITFEHD